MATVPLYDIEGSRTGELSLSDEVFGVQPNKALLHQVVVAAQAAQRQGTQDAKTRSEVAGSTRKLWRQKGTGRARVGDRRSPNRTGGGVAMGPHPRSYRQRLPRTAKLEGLRSALSAQVQSGALLVLESLELPEPKTKLLKGVLDSVGVSGRALLVLAAPDELVWRSGRNIPGLVIVPASDVNALDVIAARKVVVLREAIAALEARLS
jgi:large subunit ribosomal protein L4